MKKPMLLLLLCAGLAGPLHARPPDWINGAGKRYPPETCLTGVGVGGNLDAARSSARAEIAKIFEARVTQSARETSTEMLSEGKNVNASEAALETSISTDQVLQGVEIKESWFDRKKKIYYALAVLNKRKMQQLLTRQIDDLEESLSRHLVNAGKAGSSVDAVKELSSALRDIDKRDALVVSRRVVDPAPIPGLTGTSRAAVAKQREELLRRIEFVVMAENDDNLVSLISSRITARGFRIVPADPQKTSGGTLITVKGKRSTATFERNNPQWKFYNWQARLDMTDSEGKIITTVLKEGQSSHITETTAESKAFAEAGGTLASALEETLKKYFFGE